MAIPVKLPVFEGPLDLLLHLIDSNKIDIYDIPIAEITDQYMAYIAQMDAADMNVMSEFLLMAATLLDIKSRMLLPHEKNEEGEEEDPRAELVEKLLEYKMYKHMSYELRDRELAASVRFYREKALPEEVARYEAPTDYAALLGDNTLQTLHGIFRQVLKRQKDKVDPVRSGFGTIPKEEVDGEAKLSYVRDCLQKGKRLSFRALLERQGSREELIVTFLIVLELAKTGEVVLRQSKVFGEITLEKAK